METTRYLQRPDGRRIAYIERGEPAGAPVFFFQGTPSSRLFQHPDASITRSLGVRLIQMDRPGFGLSDFQPGRTFLDWPKEVAALADTLGIERFAIAGISGGGPYVAACAFSLPRRVTRAAFISCGGPADAPQAKQGMAPIRQAGFAIGRHAPWLMLPMQWLFFNPQRDAERFLRRYGAGSAASDEAIMARPDVHAMFIDNYREATRNGLRGFAHETSLCARPWGFPLEKIGVEVDLWHGEDDHSTPAAMARYMAQAIPGCQAHFLPGEGHLLIFNHWREILTALIR